MKRISLLLVIALLLFAVTIFASCDQETVDSTRSEIMDACVDLLGPYLTEATESSGTASSSSQATDSSADTSISQNITVDSQGSTDGSDNSTVSVISDVSDKF